MTSGAQSTPRRGSGQLGPDWVPGADGILFRNAARLIVVDESDRVLMVRGHDIDDPGRRWWFTVGGGIDPGESPREAAVRELAEETGLCVDTDELVGPVLTRRAEFDFVRQTVRQDEVFFFARVASPGEITTDGWTDVEQRFMDEVRWWHLDDLADVSHQVYPEGFVDLVKGLLGGRDDVARASGDRSGESVGQSGSVIDGVPHP